MACVKGLLENYLNSQEKLFSKENYLHGSTKHLHCYKTF